VKLLLDAVKVVIWDIFDQAGGRDPAWHMHYLSAAHDEVYKKLVSNTSCRWLIGSLVSIRDSYPPAGSEQE
jgi:hypothetical protein